uniref:Uncharacterized protein n=1 Tax=Musa acuminata subsp. malaccensis TaxID=214687 RepID=A0A804JFY6_MUSAM
MSSASALRGSRQSFLSNHVLCTSVRASPPP